MLRLTDCTEIPSDFADAVVTIGKFDGVHLGHQALISETLTLADEHGLAAVAITFDRSPIEVLQPDKAQPALTGATQKLDLFEDLGIDATLTLQFDERLAALSPEEFVRTFLLEGLKAKAVVVGHDFRFGRGGTGDIALLKLLGAENGFVVRTVDAVEVDGVRVSSTHIRQLLDEAQVVQAAKHLGRLHSTRGLVEHGLKIGRTLGFPTANLSRDSEGYLPVDGVYAGWLHADSVRYPAALSIGINDTIQAVPRLIEAHVLDRDDLDLYDKVVTVEYVEHIRPSAKFNSVEQLIQAIAADCQAIRDILAHR